jgi:hypothetical protein
MSLNNHCIKQALANNHLVKALLLLLSMYGFTNATAATLTAADFFTKDGISQALLSPNGQYTALLEQKDSKQYLYLVNSTSKLRFDLLNTDDFSQWEAGIDDIVWLDDPM